MERIEDLGRGLRLTVSDEHTFGTDALLLADFAAPTARETACDLGTGCGIIPFYWLRAGLCASVTAVDIQPAATALLEKSVRMNGAGDKIIPVNADLRRAKELFPAGAFSLVTMNPPYTAVGSGILSSSDSGAVARHETMCSLSDVCHAAAHMLKFGGRLCMCVKTQRLTELIYAMRDAGIEPKRLRFVAKNAASAPWLILLEGKKGRRPGISVMPQLYTRSPDGGDSAEMLRIIGEYRDK